MTGSRKHRLVFGITVFDARFGLDGEYAMSWWDVDMEYAAKKTTFENQVKEAPVPDGKDMTKIVYVSSIIKSSETEKVMLEDVLKDQGKALNVRPYVEGSVAGVNFKVNGMYLMNDKEFWSDLASSPNYTNNGIIFNANALYGDADQEVAKNFASGNLENLYFMVYNTDLLTAATIMSSGAASAKGATALSDNSEHTNMYFRLYNNYKLAHFYRNGYDAKTMKKLEAAEALGVGSRAYELVEIG